MMIDVLYMKGYVLVLGINHDRSTVHEGICLIVLGINHDRSTVHEGIWFSSRYIS